MKLIILIIDGNPVQDQASEGSSTCLPFNTILSEPLVGVGVALSDAIGCPIEFIILPLLTIIAGYMGVNAHISITEQRAEKDGSITAFVETSTGNRG